MTRVRDVALIVGCLVVSSYYGWELRQVWNSYHHTSSNIILSGRSSEETKSAVQIPWQTPPPEVTPPQDHPPLTVVGGELSYRIHYTTHEWLLANHSSAISVHAAQDAPGLKGFDRTIWLYRGDPNPRGTLMHELFHVAKELGDEQHWDFTWDAPGQNHDFIDPASQELLIIFRRNPALVKWFMGGNPIMQE